MSSVCRNCGLVGRSFTSEYALACSSVWRVNVVCEAVDLWRMRLSSCQKAKGHHFEHLLNKNVFFLSHQHVCREEHVTLRVIYVAATQKQMKKELRETQTLRTGCSKAEPKKFAPPQTPFPGARDGQNLISWRWSLPLPTNSVWCRSMHAISSYSCNRRTNKHKPTDRTDYNTLRRS